MVLEKMLLLHLTRSTTCVLECIEVGGATALHYTGCETFNCSALVAPETDTTSQWTIQASWQANRTNLDIA